MGAGVVASAVATNCDHRISDDVASGAANMGGHITILAAVAVHAVPVFVYRHFVIFARLPWLRARRPAGAHVAAQDRLVRSLSLDIPFAGAVATIALLSAKGFS